MCGVERTVVGAREAYHRPFDLFDERDGGGEATARSSSCVRRTFFCLSVYLCEADRVMRSEEGPGRDQYQLSVRNETLVVKGATTPKTRRRAPKVPIPNPRGVLACKA